MLSLLRLLPLLLVLAACGQEQPDATAETAPAAVAATRTVIATPEEPKAPEGPQLVADRRYEQLLKGRRAATLHVRWWEDDFNGTPALRDVTIVRSRTVRNMAGFKNVFESTVTSTTWRSVDGELFSQEHVVQHPSRQDREIVTRSETGYDVETFTGENHEAFTIATDQPAMVDAESFLGPYIRRGEATPGKSFTFHLLSTGRRALLESTLQVVGPDDEGPGLKVTETILGHTSLWWFDDTGAVVRHRGGDTVLRRDDGIDLAPASARRAATFDITLHTNVEVPRLFTARRLDIAILVRTDETVSVPRIPENPFTKVERVDGSTVHAACLAHDDPATKEATLPLPTEGLEEHLEPTPVMEVDDPEVRALARRIVDGETNARKAARKIADHVFKILKKGSPDMGEPTAKQILKERVGDCSEHALLFTALCRAAGIPARRCSGYVCIGSDWGAHAWCEIWLGRWIGADPTTNEIGTRARYIFCGRQEDRTMTPASIRAERTRIVIRRAEFESGTLEFDEDGRPSDPALFTGIDLAPLPEGWEARPRGTLLRVEGPNLAAMARVRPDHGYDRPEQLQRMGLRPEALAGRTAFRQGDGWPRRWIVPLGRETVELQVWVHGKGKGDAEAELKTMIELLKPTLTRE